MATRGMATRGMATRCIVQPIFILAFQLLLIGGLIPSVCLQWSGEGTLADYEVASFDNPIVKSETLITRLDHFAVHPQTGDVYVGAVNYLYKLNKDLKQITNVNTCSIDNCLNYNKVLALHDGKLVSCGSKFPDSDQCQLRGQGDLLGEGNSREGVVSYGTRAAVSIVAPWDDLTTERLYVATSYSRESGYQNIDPISRRSLASTGTSFMTVNRNDKLEFSTPYRDNYAANPYPIQYVGVFNWDGFTYFASFQRQYRLASPHVSKLARLCHNFDNAYSYTEILITCSGSTEEFSLIQAAHVGTAGSHLAKSLGLDEGAQVLYAVFAKDQSPDSPNPDPMADSALCIYKMSDIQAAFTEAVRGCIQSGDDYETKIFSGGMCGTQTDVNHTQYICDTGNNYRYAIGIATVPGTSVVNLPGHLASSIITSTELNHTVAFIGTTGGQLLKVHIENSTSARFYETVSLDDNQVMQDTMLSETEQQMYVLTEQKLIKIRVENCGRYTTCETCIGTDAGNDGDPYCGWCTLERRCTRYHDCPMQEVSTRWLAYNDAQCVEITVTPHNSLPITLTDQQITLTVQQLPDLLDGRQYMCEFGSQYSILATNYNGDSFNCITPPLSDIPEIQTGEDHVTVVLSVMSTETSVNFVDINFDFYECNTHETCVSCVGSRWACDWCVFDNRCTHESSTCTKDNEIIITGEYSRGMTMQGPDVCPQLQPQSSEVLIPNDIDKGIVVAVANLPDEAQISSFQCSLAVEPGSVQSVAATRTDSTVTCNMKTYTYTAAVQELNASLTLQWTDVDNVVHTLDDRHEFTVTLYKCEVLRPDCSRCISEETTRVELGCMWCGDTCGVLDSTVCMMTSDKVTRNDTMNCPNPELMQVYPLFGPIEGNTTMTIYGTDIGLRHGDIREVTIAGQICTLVNFEYSTGNSVSCITPVETPSRQRRDVTPRSLQMMITGRDGSIQTSEGNVTFGYKDPLVTGFNPEFGPKSGGTRLTINGQSLDGGRYINVSIDNMQCAADRMVVTDDSITCITSGTDSIGSWIVTISFDGAQRYSTDKYTYAVDPDVRYINPSTSVLAGGRELKVNGSGFSIIQQPQIVITQDVKEFVANCSVKSDDIMMCTSPEINLPNLDAETSVNVTTGFIMDDVQALRPWCSVDQNDDCTLLEYFLNPVYYQFNVSVYENENGIERKEGPSMTIKGSKLNLAITDEEVTVYVGKSLCTGVTVGESALTCTLPDEEPSAGDYMGMDTSKGLPVVWVIHGTTLSFNIGYIQYPFNVLPVIIGVSVCVLLVAALLAVVLKKKSKGAQQQVDRRLQEIDNVQIKLADDMRTAFAELQTDVLDVTSDLEGIGMPFVSHREYATNMLFIGQDTKPMTSDPENPEEHVEKAMKKFSDALSNKTFLLMFLQTLDAQNKSKLSVKDRAAIASLITVLMVAEGKLDYLTDVLFSLMAKLVQDELDANRPKQLFRRTETILEKLLSNWITLCMYDSLKDDTAYPLFLLYRAIKCHSEHGPIDIISGQAKFTLSDDKLLTEDTDYREMVLTVTVNNADGEIKEVKVLDVDTISQVKEKILDSIHRSQPYSRRPSANEVDLEWHSGANGRQILRDVDHTSVALDGWKRVNTLKFYHVPNKSTMALVGGPTKSGQMPSTDDSVYVNFGFDNSSRDSASAKIIPASNAPRSHRFTMVEAQEEDVKLWHLAKCEEGAFDYNESTTTKHRKNRISRRLTLGSRPKRILRELYIPRLISTKGTIQEYINRMFESILNADTAPRAVKYLFDFFDSQAVRHSIQDADAVRNWKGNSLSLRFWSNAIRRPDFIFDIRTSRSVEASLGIIAQAFYDAHNVSDKKLGKDSDLSKLLFNKDQPRIQSLVGLYYDGICNKPFVPVNELNKELALTSQNFNGLFSKLSTLLQLWGYVKKYNTKIVEACEDDEACKNEHLAYKLVEVETILDNQDCDAEEGV